MLVPHEHARSLGARTLFGKLPHSWGLKAVPRRSARTVTITVWVPGTTPGCCQQPCVGCTCAISFVSQSNSAVGGYIPTLVTHYHQASSCHLVGDRIKAQ